VRYPAVPVVFCDTRPLAQEWAYRFLGAAVAELRRIGKLFGSGRRTTEVFADFSARLGEGRFTVVTGPSGSGTAVGTIASSSVSLVGSESSPAGAACSRSSPPLRPSHRGTRRVAIGRSRLVGPRSGTRP
jgi:hypothetical protein